MLFRSGAPVAAGRSFAVKTGAGVLRPGAAEAVGGRADHLYLTVHDLRDGQRPVVGAVATQAEYPARAGKSSPCRQCSASDGLAVAGDRADGSHPVIPKAGQGVRLSSIGGGISAAEL